MSERHSGPQGGSTSRQMLGAPLGATFVWCNNRLFYPEALARVLGRSDLRIKPLSWMRPDRFFGDNFRAMVIDHATHLDREDFEVINRLRDRGVEVLL